MKITICGSIAFFDNMLKVKSELESLGHEVKTPPTTITDNAGKQISVERYYEIRKTETDPTSWVWNTKTIAIQNHFDKIYWSDAILVLNYDKNQIKNYIGANTFLEMGVAFYLKKPIYLFNNIPQQENTEEILGLKPIQINQDLSKIS
jgi:hypothetical protein